MRTRYGNKQVLSRHSRAQWGIMLEYMLDEFERTADNDDYELDWETLEITTERIGFDAATFVSSETIWTTEINMRIEAERKGQ